MSNKSGVDAYAGDIVDAQVDYVMVNDVTGPIAFKEFEALGCDIQKDKVVLVPDHYVPNKDIASAFRQMSPEERRILQGVIDDV